MNEVLKKHKVFVSPLVRAQMEQDVREYELRSLSDLCNSILSHYDSFSLPKSDTRSELFKNYPPIQFSLQQRNQSFAIHAKSLPIKQAAICRHYFEEYVSLPRGKRECLIKTEELTKLKMAIQKRYNVSFSYKGKEMHVAPCFIDFSPSQVRTYVVVCEKNEAEPVFLPLRLIFIKGVAVDSENLAFHYQDHALFKQAECFKEHFDPFLCHGQKVVVRLTDAGVTKLKRAATNRPKFDPNETKEQVYTFECSEKLAQVYFPQFLEDAEILSPISLRQWFKKHFQQSLKIYKDE